MQWKIHFGESNSELKVNLEVNNIKKKVLLEENHWQSSAHIFKVQDTAIPSSNQIFNRNITLTLIIATPLASQNSSQLSFEIFTYSSYKGFQFLREMT